VGKKGAVMTAISARTGCEHHEKELMQGRFFKTLNFARGNALLTDTIESKIKKRTI